jgi:hypothetical protein
MNTITDGKKTYSQIDNYLKEVRAQGCIPKCRFCIPIGMRRSV